MKNSSPMPTTGFGAERKVVVTRPPCDCTPKL